MSTTSAPLKRLEASGQAKLRVLAFLDKRTYSITTSAAIRSVAPLFALGAQLADVSIALGLEETGKEGAIAVKEGRTLEDKIEIADSPPLR